MKKEFLCRLCKTAIHSVLKLYMRNHYHIILTVTSILYLQYSCMHANSKQCTVHGTPRVYDILVTHKPL